MRSVLCVVAVIALALFWTPVRAQTAMAPGAGAHHSHHHWQPRKAHYGKKMRAHTGTHCKMTGSC